MPSPVDWSEFHVWCYALADVQKTSLSYDMRRNAIDIVCPGCVTSRYGKQTTVNMNKLPPPAHTSPVYQAYAQFAAGAIGGGTATYTTHWLDTIKVKMQTFPSAYRSGVSCLRHTLREEGVRGLYQGASPAVLGQAVKAAVVFCSYGVCEEIVKNVAGRETTDDLDVWQHASAGAMTAIMASFFLCPLELIKCRLQALRHLSTTNSKVVLRPPLSMAREVIQGEGIRGMYRGLNGIWVKDIPGSFIYFGSYEAAKSAMTALTGHKHQNCGELFACGVFAGLCFCVTHPVESVKTRVQVMSAVNEQRGFISAFVHILRTEGLRPLCNGLRPSMLRACIYSGIQFLTYEKVKAYFLNGTREQDS